MATTKTDEEGKKYKEKTREVIDKVYEDELLRKENNYQKQIDRFQDLLSQVKEELKDFK